MKTTIERAWSINTCYPGDKEKFLTGHPSTGQCAVTALLIQEMFGGSIIHNQKLNHYYNLIDQVNQCISLDMTKAQFPEGTETTGSDVVSREKLLENQNTKERYYVLRERFIFMLRHPDYEDKKVS